MKYLFVNSSLTDGGSERVMTMIANQFAEEELDTSMIILREKTVSNYEMSPKLKYYQCRYGTKNKFIILIKRFAQVRSYIKKYNPDVIVSFMWDINLFTLIVCLGLHKKVIISERNYPISKINNIFRRIWRDLGQRYIYLLADRIVLQTEQVRQFYCSEVQKKCVVIPNPINPVLPEAWEGKRENKIIAVGRFTTQKNFPMLIKAFATFHKKHPEYELVIYGDGSMRVAYAQLIEQLNLNDCVKLPGYITNVNDKMRSAAVYVSSSDFEGISNAMLEALAMGVPSICTDCPVGGAAMVIKNGENGILIPVGGEKELYRELCHVVEDKDYAEQLSQNAQLVKEEYAINKIANEWIKILNEELK